MSLDVYLSPTKCPHCGRTAEGYSRNITHNLGKMAREAGIYEACWRPDEAGFTKAAQLIQPLTQGIAMMKSDPARFKALDAPNGWGTFDDFLPWVEDYLAACISMPDADVSVSR